MSGIKPVALTWFYRSLHARGTNLTRIADQIFCGRSHLSQVISGKRPGGHTWRKLMTVLTPEELTLLRDAGVNVPRSTNSHMEHETKEVANGR